MQRRSERTMVLCCNNVSRCEFQWSFRFNIFYKKYMILDDDMTGYTIYYTFFQKVADHG